MAPIVQLNSLTKDYGRVRAVDNVSLAIAPGEVFGLLGPNGSGKSTILKMLTGLLMPTAGSVAVDGLDLATNGAAARTRLGYVQEDAALYPALRVNEFLRFMAALKGLAKPALGQALERVTVALKLEAVTHSTIGKLSRGFRQRVAIAQALLTQPPLLVLDEPTNGLDPHQIIEIRELIAHLAPTHTVLVTSHILSEIERVASRVGILLAGRLLAPPELSAPPTLRVRIAPLAGVNVESIMTALSAVAAVMYEDTPGPLATYRVTLTAWEAAPAVCAALCARGVAVHEFARADESLEAHFLNATRQAS